MNPPMIWLSSPHLSGEEQKYIADAFQRGQLFAWGDNVNAFEQDLESYLGSGFHVAAMNSGTSAIHLCLLLLNVQPGDIVLCQSFTFAASANPVVYLGATPVFIDSEPDTWGMSPEYLEQAIQYYNGQNKKPKAIIAAHLYGTPYKSDEINTVAAKYGIPVLEDSAEALGSFYKGRKCGTLADISVLSFNGNKIITASSGGAVVSASPEVKKRAVFLASQAKDPAPHYQHSEIGYNYRISNICAGIGRGQMEVLENRIALRRENHAFYKSLFKDISFVTVYETPGEDFYSNYWLTTITVNDAAEKKSAFGLMEWLASNFIESRPLWKPLHMQPVFKKNAYFGTDVAETLFNTGLCLPSGSNLSTNEKERITQAVHQWLVLKQ